MPESRGMFAETPNGMEKQLKQLCRHLQRFSATKKKYSTKISYWEDDLGSLTDVTSGSV